MILDSESEVKEKRGGRDLRQFVVFVMTPCCWDDNFEIELGSFMKIWCQILAGNDKELEGRHLHSWLRGVFDAQLKSELDQAGNFKTFCFGRVTTCFVTLSTENCHDNVRIFVLFLFFFALLIHRNLRLLNLNILNNYLRKQRLQIPVESSLSSDYSK